MNCKREGCDKPVTGKALYCSGACRTKVSRVSVTPSVTDVTVKASVTSEHEVLLGKVLGEPIPDPDPDKDYSFLTGLASLEDYHSDRGRRYVPRSEPDKLNWGPWMSSDELGKAGLKANRVSIPGDWDYTQEFWE